MTRQEANKEILRILKDPLLDETLRKADCLLSSKDFMLEYDNIKNYIDNHPDVRWCQSMWNLGINRGYGDNDRFYEESMETLVKLKQ